MYKVKSYAIVMHSKIDLNYAFEMEIKIHNHFCCLSDGANSLHPFRTIVSMSIVKKCSVCSTSTILYYGFWFERVSHARWTLQRQNNDDGEETVNNKKREKNLVQQSPKIRNLDKAKWIVIVIQNYGFWPIENNGIASNQQEWYKYFFFCLLVR